MALTAEQGAGTQEGEYLHVWGDTVRGRRLLLGVATGVVCAVVGLYGGRALFLAVGLDEEMANVWSLITGILFCVLAGVITARITSPSRIISDDAHESGRLSAVIREMGAEGRGLGTLEDASVLSRSELEAAGLTAEFRAAEAEAAGAGTEPAGRAAEAAGAEKEGER